MPNSHKWPLTIQNFDSELYLYTMRNIVKHTDIIYSSQYHLPLPVNLLIAWSVAHSAVCPPAHTHMHAHTKRYFRNSKCQCVHNQYKVQQNCSMFHLNHIRRATYLQCNNEAASQKQLTTSYSGCVSTACKAHVPYHIVTWDLSGYTIFFHIIS